MYSEVDIAAVAGLLADRTRVDLLVALSGGVVARPAGELARLAGVSPSVASVHLSRLLDAELVAVEQQGRHRYYRLANPEIIAAFEPLARLAPLAPIRSLHQDRRIGALRAGRRCYDHLAGEIGVRITDAMRNNGWISTNTDCWTLTDAGRQAILGLGIVLRDSRRSALLRPCLDWSERRHHLAGTLGAALLAQLTSKGWLQPHPETRAVAITDTGAAELAAYFRLESIAPSID